MGNFLKDIAGLAVGGPAYGAHRLFGDDPGDAIGHTFADQFLGAPFSLLGHATQARRQNYGYTPNYGGSQSPYSDFGCNCHGRNQLARYGQENYAAGVQDGFYAGYQAAFAQMAAYSGSYGLWA